MNVVCSCLLYHLKRHVRSSWPSITIKMGRVGGTLARKKSKNSKNRSAFIHPFLLQENRVFGTAPSLTFSGGFCPSLLMLLRGRYVYPPQLPLFPADEQLWLPSHQDCIPALAWRSDLAFHILILAFQRSPWLFQDRNREPYSMKGVVACVLLIEDAVCRCSCPDFSTILNASPFTVSGHKVKPISVIFSKYVANCSSSSSVKTVDGPGLHVQSTSTVPLTLLHRDSNGTL